MTPWKLKTGAGTELSFPASKCLEQSAPCVCTKYSQESPFSSTEHSRVQQQANIFIAIEVASINTHIAPNSFQSNFLSHKTCFGPIQAFNSQVNCMLGKEMCSVPQENLKCYSMA